MTACSAGPVSGRQQPRLVTRRNPARVRARLRTDRQGQRGGPRPDECKRGRDRRADSSPLPFAGGGGQGASRRAVVARRHADRGECPQHQGQAAQRVGHLRARRGRVRPTPDHADATQRRQSGLVARWQADRVQLLVRGPGGGRDLHRAARREPAEAPAPRAEGELLVRAGLVPRRRAHRVRARNLRHGSAYLDHETRTARDCGSSRTAPSPTSVRTGERVVE